MVKKFINNKLPSEIFLYFNNTSKQIFILYNNKTIILSSRNLNKLKAIFENENIVKTGYDLKKIYKFLRKYDIELKNLHFDVSIATALLGNLRGNITSRKIASEPEIFLGLLPTIKENLLNELKEKNLFKVFKEIEIPLIKVLAEMEIVGIKIDLNKLEDVGKEVEREVKNLKDKIYAIAGMKFNINSPKQVAEILFNKLKISKKAIRKTSTGQLSTGAKELSKISEESELGKLIAEYRELFKLQTSYIEKFKKVVDKKRKVIYTTFNQVKASTGRLSSEEPNLQNLPTKSEYAQKIKECFIASKGFKFLSADYSQLELRIIASLANDQKMINAFLSGLDIHKKIAAEVFNVNYDEVTDEMRQKAKMLNFGIIYGMGARGFAEAANMPYEEAVIFIDEYFSDFFNVANYIFTLKQLARERGYSVTLFGRKRFLPSINALNPKLRAQAERFAINMPIQGTAADIVKMAMINLDNNKRLKKIGVRMLLQVHDELLFEIPKKNISEAARIIKETMEGVYKFAVPLVVDLAIGDDLRNLKSFSAF